MRQNVAMLERSDRPWGSYTVLSDEADHKVKRIVVHPGRRLSYQRHSQRSEHWFIVSGSGNFVLDDATKPVGPGDAVDIPRGSAHRIENTHASEPLVFIEVQHGTYFGEDDIERLEDDYGRAGTNT
ncbi:MAG TPA: phosphomannose isomerase type II C-terminal cupin domain [Microthrixaceae bacterium]|nr:phosphomannose isomerase type II C-terminal cupin domain [Microthrixaceae bacterium]